MEQELWKTFVSTGPVVSEISALVDKLRGLAFKEKSKHFVVMIFEKLKAAGRNFDGKNRSFFFLKKNDFRFMPNFKELSANFHSQDSKKNKRTVFPDEKSPSSYQPSIESLLQKTKPVLLERYCFEY